MASILWVDGNPQEIIPKKALLEPLGTKVVLAKDCPKALKRFHQEHFDLIILELAVEPEPWGGLELLRLLQEQNIRVPALVVSETASSKEISRALRLGASDFVHKEELEESLLVRVEALLSKQDEELNQFLCIHAPTPIALPYKRFLTSPNPPARLKRFVEFYETVMKFSSLIGLALLARGVEPEFDPVVRNALLRPPSMGTWSHVAAEVGKYLPGKTAFHVFNQGFAGETLVRVIELRNDMAHGTEPSARVALEHLNDFLEPFNQLKRHLMHRLEMKLVLPLNMTYDGQAFDVTTHRLHGDSITPPAHAERVQTPPVCHHVHLVSGQNPREMGWLDLHPFVRAEAGREPGTWTVHLYEGTTLAKGISQLTGEEAIRYLNLWTGTRENSEHRATALPEFLKRNPPEDEPEVPTEGDEKSPQDQGELAESFLGKVAEPLRPVYAAWFQRWVDSPLIVAWGSAGLSLRVKRADKELAVLDAYPEWAVSLITESDVVRLRVDPQDYEQYLSHMRQVPQALAALATQKKYMKHDKLEPEELNALLGAATELAVKLGESMVLVQKT